jgi:hypothetical protein
MNLPKIKVPLILGIWGGKGQVRTGGGRCSRDCSCELLQLHPPAGMLCGLMHRGVEGIRCNAVLAQQTLWGSALGG